MKRKKKHFQALHLGLQFNRSEHRPVKAEAAGSSPVSPDRFTKYINHLSLFCQQGNRNKTFIPGGLFFLSLFVSAFSSNKNREILVNSTSTGWQYKDICIMQIGIIAGSTIVRIPRDNESAFQMEQRTICFPSAHTKKEFLFLQLKINLTEFP